MLKALFSIWKQDNLLSQSVDQFNDMLQQLHSMFNWSMEFVSSYEEGQKVDELYKRDIKINQAERAIRKKIVEHLTFQPGIGISQSLILMSIVKDAERIGDYCKNITEVIINYGKVFKEDEYSIEIRKFQKDIDELFVGTLECFKEDNKSMATAVLRKDQILSKQCDDFILRVLDAENLKFRRGISYVLMVRFYKRIISHLGNIASSVSMPIHKLDYYDEKSLPTQKTN